MAQATTSRSWRCRAAGLLVLALAGATAAGVQERGPDGAAPAARARELIQRARLAIGGEAALRKVQSLSATGKLQRFTKYLRVTSPEKVEEREKTLSGKVEFDFSFPDKFRRREAGHNLRGFGYSFAEVANGAQAWREPPLVPRASSGDNRIIDVADVERSYASQAQSAREQLSLYTLGWLLTTSPSFPVEFSYAGDFQLDGRALDVILVSGPNEFQPVLLLDRATHLPFALAFTFVEPHRENVVVEVTGFSRSYIRETYARARRERAARATPPQRNELQLRFSDHRPVEGVLLPHRVTTVLNGRVVEEWVLHGIALNHRISTKKFEEPAAQKNRPPRARRLRLED